MHFTFAYHLSRALQFHFRHSPMKMPDAYAHLLSDHPNRQPWIVNVAVDYVEYLLRETLVLNVGQFPPNEFIGTQG